MRILIFISALLFMYSELQAQCSEKNTAYTTGEVLNYEIYYNWGLIWLNAGYVDFKVKAGAYKGRRIYHFDSYGASYKSYDWIFKVRDHYQCFFDQENLRPLWFHRQNYEGGFEVDYKYVFDWDENKIYSTTWNSDRPFSQDTFPAVSCSFDVLSLIYHCRNLNFEGLNVGDSLPVKTFIDNEYYDLYIRYLGKETIKTRDNKSFRCIKFSALLVEGTIFSGGENLFVWVTDDENQAPILVEAKILVGSVKAYFISAEGLRNKQEALVE